MDVANQMDVTAAVVFVSDLSRSRDFYVELMDLAVQSETEDALALSDRDGHHLVLREMEGANHFSGGLGVQYLIWAARDEHDLERCEEILRRREAFVATWNDAVGQLIEGHDPDRVPIMIASPREGVAGSASLLNRLLAY